MSKKVEYVPNMDAAIENFEALENLKQEVAKYEKILGRKVVDILNIIANCQNDVRQAIGDLVLANREVLQDGKEPPSSSPHSDGGRTDPPVEGELVEDEIVWMERGETKTTKSPMWRCKTKAGRRVNIFKHDDPAKDSFALFWVVGYGDFMEAMKVGDVLTWEKRPKGIRVYLTKKGNWWEVARLGIDLEGPVEPDAEEKPHPSPPHRNGEGRPPADTPLRVPTEGAPLDDRGEAVKWAKELVKGEFLVLDTETTGLTDGDEVCELAIIDQEGEVLFNELIKPSVPIDDGAAAVHGISEDMVKDAKPLSEYVGQLNEIMQGKKVVIYNAAFDLNMLKRSGLKTKPWRVVDCAMEWYAQFNGDWNDYHGNYRWVRLEQAARQMGIEDVQEHRALGDCVMTLGVIKAMAGWK